MRTVGRAILAIVWVAMMLVFSYASAKFFLLAIGPSWENVLRLVLSVIAGLVSLFYFGQLLELLRDN